MEILDVIQFLAKVKVTSNGICEGDVLQIWKLIGVVVRWIQIAVPVILVLLGTIDLAKAVMAGDDKVIKESQKMFIKRLIYGAVVFFVVAIVQVVFGAFANSTVNDSATCFQCVANPNKCPTES